MKKPALCADHASLAMAALFLRVKRASLVLCIFGALDGAGSSLRAEPDYSFYDPSRPGRHLKGSMIVPKAPKSGQDTQARPVKIYTLLDYPGDANVKKPTITATFNGKPLKVDLLWRPTPGLPWWVKIRATVPASEIIYAAGGHENKLKMTATLANGTAVERELIVKGVPLPAVDEERVMGSYLDGKGFQYALLYRFPPSPFKLGTIIPALGKYGVNFQMNGRMIINPMEMTCYTETTGQGGLVLSDEEYTLEAGTKDTSEWKDDHWVKTESKLYVGLSTSFVLWEKNVLSVVPAEGKKALDYIPFLGPKFKKTLEEVKVSLTLDPSLSGVMDLPLDTNGPDKWKFKNITFTGEMDLKLTGSVVLELQGFGKFGAQIMMGGKLDLDIEQPGVGFKSFSASVYVGADFYFLAFESNLRYTLVEFHIPSTPKSGAPKGALAEVEEGALKLVPPPAADEVLEYPLTPMLKAGPPQSGVQAQALATAKANFRQLGVVQRLTRATMKSTLGAANGNPVIEASAVLPLALNTTSVAWPNMASHIKTGGMLILFGVDTRPAGSTEEAEKSSQFTEVRWTYSKNGEWTAPVQLPKGNGAAQIAPSVSVLSAAKPQYLAAWQQLEDPNFKEAKVTDWLNQTQVAVGVFQVEDEKGAKVNKWTTQILGEPGRADMSPKVIGQAGDNMDEGVVTWISAGISEVANNNTAGMPDGAEFRFARYKDGKWNLPDPKTAFPKVPKGLLSWDFYALKRGGLLAYSEDIGNGNSRIMFYLYNHEAKTSDQVWAGPAELSKEVGKNLNPKVMMSMVNGVGLLSVVWNEKGNLVVRTMGGRTNSKETLRPATDGMVPPNAVLTALNSPNAGDSGMAVSWTEQTTSGASIVTSVFDPNIRHWSKAVPITPGEDMETLYTATTDAAGNLVPLYVHTDISYGDVKAPDENGDMVIVPNSPIPGREKIMIGRFRPTRDLGFAPAGLTATSDGFIAGTTAKLTAHVESKGMLGFPSVSVSFYHGDPKKGGKLIATGKSAKPVGGGSSVDVSVDWKLADNIWDQEYSSEEVFAVIQKPEGVTEWNPDNNVATLRVDEIVLSATASADKAKKDGSADVDVTIHNGGSPYASPFPVMIYDYSGARLITTEMMPKVEAGGVSNINLELPKDSVQGANGADFLVKVDPENTLKLPGNPKVEVKVHIPSVTN